MAKRTADYRYLSRRLLTELVQRDQAKRSRWRATPGVSVSGAGLQLSRVPLDIENIYAVARRAEQLIEERTFDLTDASAGDYVRDETDLNYGVLKPLMGWPGGEVACYWGEKSTLDAGRTFVALFGSASNVIGYRSEDGLGYYPSDLYGLYTMLDQVREQEDPDVDAQDRWDDSHLNGDRRAEVAVGFARSSSQHPIGAHDYLAWVHIDVPNFADDTFEGRVVVGTPLWVATK